MRDQLQRVYYVEQGMDRRRRLEQGSARKLEMIRPGTKRTNPRNQAARGRKYKRRKDKSDWAFYGLVVMAVLLLFFYSKVRAAGQEDMARDQALYYREQVDGYTKIIREELADRGYANSGITTTCIIDGQIRTYRIGIHHERLNRLAEEGQAELLGALEEIPFKMDGVKTELQIIL